MLRESEVAQIFLEFSRYSSNSTNKSQSVTRKLNKQKNSEETNEYKHIYKKQQSGKFILPKLADQQKEIALIIFNSVSNGTDIFKGS